VLNAAARLIFSARRSARYSVNSTDCEFRGEFDSSYVFWHFAAFMAQCRHTLLAVYAVPPMSTVVATTARPTQCRWSFHQLDARHSAIAPFLWLGPEHGTTFRQRSGPSLLTFRQQLKTFQFFKQHFTDLMTDLCTLNCIKSPGNILKC